jgi:hypothetical protein
VRIPSWLEADPALHSEAVYIEADRFFHQKILLAIGRRTIHSDPNKAVGYRSQEPAQLVRGPSLGIFFGLPTISGMPSSTISPGFTGSASPSSATGLPFAAAACSESAKPVPFAKK